MKKDQFFFNSIFGLWFLLGLPGLVVGVCILGGEQGKSFWQILTTLPGAYEKHPL